MAVFKETRAVWDKHMMVKMGPVPTTSVLKRTSVTANRVFGYAPPLSASPNLETKKPILATTASRQEDEDNVPAKPSVPAPPPVADPSLETKKPILVTTASRQEDEVPIIVFENLRQRMRKWTRILHMSAAAPCSALRRTSNRTTMLCIGRALVTARIDRPISHV